MVLQRRNFKRNLTNGHFASLKESTKTPFTRDRSDLVPVQLWHRTAFRSHGTDETGLVLDRQSVLVWDQVKVGPVLDRYGSELVRSRINTSTGLVLVHFHGRGLKPSTVLVGY